MLPLNLRLCSAKVWPHWLQAELPEIIFFAGAFCGKEPLFNPVLMTPFRDRSKLVDRLPKRERNSLFQCWPMDITWLCDLARSAFAPEAVEVYDLDAEMTLKVDPWVV